MRYFITCIILTLSCGFLNAQQSSFSGKAIEKVSKEPILFGTVAIYKDGVLLTGTDTDYDGNFYIKLEPGKYKVEAKYLGMADKTLDIEIKKGENLKLTIEMEEGRILDFEPIFFRCFQDLNLVNIADPFSGQTFIPLNGFLRPNVGSSY